MTDTAGAPDIPVSVLDHAIRYVENDHLALCLIQTGTKRPVLAAWNDPNRVLTSREAVTQALGHLPYGIGLVHERAHTAAIDVDHLDAARALFNEFGWDYDALFAAFPRISTRAGKDKILVRLPEGFDPSDTVQSKRVLTWPDPSGECDERGRPALITVLELRGGKNQDVLPPSIHPDTGLPYAWAENQAPWHFNGIPTLPADHPLLIIWAQWETFRPQLEAACPWRSKDLDLPIPGVKILAASEHNDIIGQYNRSTTCALLLERHGYSKRGKRWLAPHSSTKIPGVIALEGSKVFSHHGSDCLNTGHAHDAFSLLTVLEHHGSVEKALADAAHTLGLSFGSAPIPSVDFTALIQNGTAKRQTKAKATPKPIPAPPPEYHFPTHLLDAPGLVGEVADYIVSTSLFAQPVLALGASLAWCGAIMGRKVRTETDLRTNLYAIGVADSGAGKEHARKALKRLAVACGMTRYVGAEKLASDQGLFALLHAQPACIVLLDEFGRMLRVINNDRAPAHLQQLMTALMELFGSADTFVIEKLRAEHTNGQAPRQIENPNLCIYGTTVPGRLFQGLTPDEITDGFLPRFLVFESDTPDPGMARPISTAPSSNLIDLTIRWNETPTNIESDGNLANINRDAPVSPAVIRMSGEAEALLDESATFWRARKITAREQGTGIDALWARAYEHAARLALIAGAGNHGEIDRPIIAWACELTDFLLTRAATQAAACVSANEYEGNLKKLQAFIEERGTVTLADVARRFRGIKPKERDGIMSALLDARLIDVSREQTSGRPTTVLSWLG